MRKVHLLSAFCYLLSILVIPPSSFAQDKSQEKLGVPQGGEKKTEGKKQEETQGGGEPVDIKADSIDYFQKKAKAVAKGNVRMIYKDVQLFSDEAEYDMNAHLVRLNGNVKIVKKDSTVYGDNAIYDFNTQNATMLNLKMEAYPLYGKADRADKIGQEKYLFKQGSYVTTCDLTHPHYRLVAKRITVYPKDRVVAKNMFLKIGNISVFYFPYFSHSLKKRYFPVQIIPGRSNKDFGLYVLNRIRYDINKTNRGKIHFDKYEKRGWAFGLTHWMEDSGYGKGLLRTYYIEDKLYDLDRRNSLGDIYPGRETTAQKYLEDDRYKVQIFYKWKPTPRLSIDSQFSKSSDENFIKDFFYLDYQIEKNPASYILIDYNFPHSSLSLNLQKRVNRWSSETQTLPQLEYNFYNQPLFENNDLEGKNKESNPEKANSRKIKLYLESKTTLANLYSKTAHSAQDSDDIRLYSHNKLSSPNTIKWLSFTPYAGLHSSFHSKNSAGDENIDRFAFETGIDLTTKLYKFFDVDFNLLGAKIEKMRHIVTPKVTYSYMHDPTVPSSQILFDAIGAQRSETVSFSLDNKLQVKDSSNKIWDFIYFSPTVNYQIDQEGVGSRFTTIDSTLEVYPKEERVSLLATSSYNPRIRRISTFNLDLSIRGPRKKIEGQDDEEDEYFLIFGHRYVRQDSSQGTFNFAYPLTSKLRLEHYFRYEYNTGDLQFQQHTLRADLHCWWMDFIFDIDKQTEGRTDFRWFIAFRLKAFPAIGVETQTKYYARKIKGHY